MLSRFITSQLPKWARPENPIMRYAIGYGSVTRRQQFRLLMALIVLMVVAIAVSYTFVAAQTDIETPTYREVMYYPLVGATLLMQILAIAMTTNSIVLERQKGTWETLQITGVGAGMSVRARWMAVFYRLRWILGMVVLGRLGYILFLMYDITDFEGRAIDVRIVGITPEVSLEVAVFLLAGLMTAAVIQPFVAVGFDAAIGMLLAGTTRSRNIGILTTLLLVGMRILITLGALYAGAEIMDANGTTAEIANMSNETAWLQTLFLTIEGDLSLRILHLETLGNLWADLDDGIYLAAIVLVLVITKAAIANALVLFSAWRVGKPAKR